MTSFMHEDRPHKRMEGQDTSGRERRYKLSKAVIREQVKTWQVICMLSC